MKGVLMSALIIAAIFTAGLLVGVRNQVRFHTRLVKDYCFSNYIKTVETQKCISDLGAD
jgi:hypothetical protein